MGPSETPKLPVMGTTNENCNLSQIRIPHKFIFDFETRFDLVESMAFMQHHEATIWLCIALYLLVIHAGQRIMKNRAGFKLRKLLIAWNAGLAVFSIWGALRTLPELWMTANSTLWPSICCLMHDVTSGKWCYLFCLSKLFEFGDTIFIILRKKPLIFLHWYHHTTVLLLSWYAASQGQAYARWFSAVNFLIHSFMYTYYFFTILGYQPFKSVQITITIMQLVQMVLGITINFLAYNILSKDHSCHISKFYIQASSFIYASYFVLFCHFFYKTYIVPKGKTKKLQ